MTVLTPEWAHELKVSAKRRLRIVKKALGIKPNQGYRARYLGLYPMNDNITYHVYEIHHVSDKGHITGLKRYALIDFATEKECRVPTSDETLMIMNNQTPRMDFD